MEQYGSTTTYNLENVLRQNILGSDYYRQTCMTLSNWSDIVDEIFEHVDHVEPWMSGNARGPSSAFCLLHRLFTLKLTAKEVKDMVDHRDSPYIRAVGFLYLRYVADPKTMWNWCGPYVKDQEMFAPSGPEQKEVTMGDYVRDLLLSQERRQVQPLPWIAGSDSAAARQQRPIGATAEGSGAADMTYQELGAALTFLSHIAAQPQQQQQPYPQHQHQHQPYPSPYTDTAGGTFHRHSGPVPPSPYNDPRFPSVIGTPPPPSPPPYDPRYHVSPQVSYDGSPRSQYDTQQAPYDTPPSHTQPYGTAAHASAYSTPSPAPYGAYAPSQYASPDAQGQYGSPQPPYGSQPQHGGPYPPYGSPSGGYNQGGYSGDLGPGGGGVATGVPAATAYYMWTHSNRQAVLQK
ncbi:Pre-mRNA-splicing factor 38B [Tetrabaena socialis]|uniref:Pre-mRNA-splicing factor 38 n=1 Tax=Tetrabaena socialis TaxID=47790 RepID=A0A2J8A5X9_9CHLO|nr:Pre-mRNA-splicing factor 38B [Tetrabaena socialis]|eukprot:PNH07907.1 Pre-mRNA-splicing factor 38B [Tetrabaena socialis]